jgi:hypothetical protein
VIDLARDVAVRKIHNQSPAACLFDITNEQLAKLAILLLNPKHGRLGRRSVVRGNRSALQHLK